MLKSDLCNYSDACIVGTGKISITGTENANRTNKKLSGIIIHLDHVYQKLIKYW